MFWKGCLRKQNLLAPISLLATSLLHISILRERRYMLCLSSVHNNEVRNDAYSAVSKLL